MHALLMSPTAPHAKPFVKWVGGKRELLAQILPRIPQIYGRYFEPFIGGGAVFFALAPAQATLRDVNSDLITTFAVVRDQEVSLEAALAEHERNHATDLQAVAAGGVPGGTHANYPYYYSVRAQDPATLDDVAKAARFIYLNRTCFNGLYRVNSGGRFNVPAGRYRKPTILDTANLRACSTALADTDVAVGDFSSIDPVAGDFVYFDQIGRASGGERA